MLQLFLLPTLPSTSDFMLDTLIWLSFSDSIEFKFVLLIQHFEVRNSFLNFSRRVSHYFASPTPLLASSRKRFQSRKCIWLNTNRRYTNLALHCRIRNGIRVIVTVSKFAELRFFSHINWNSRRHWWSEVSSSPYDCVSFPSGVRDGWNSEALVDRWPIITQDMEIFCSKVSSDASVTMQVKTDPDRRVWGSS